MFEGSMTDTDVKINGTSAGPTHQGAFYRFQYDVSALLRYDSPNLLEVTVADESANASINGAERSADYWVFGGIFRPVYLAAFPSASIDHVGADARADGTLSVNVTLENAPAGQVVATVLDAQAQPVGAALSAPVTAGQANVSFTGVIPGVKTWSAEAPDLYRVVVSLEQEGQPVHRVVETISCPHGRGARGRRRLCQRQEGDVARPQPPLVLAVDGARAQRFAVARRRRAAQGDERQRRAQLALSAQSSLPRRDRRAGALPARRLAG